MIDFITEKLKVWIWVGRFSVIGVLLAIIYFHYANPLIFKDPLIVGLTCTVLFMMMLWWWWVVYVIKTIDRIQHTLTKANDTVEDLMVSIKEVKQMAKEQQETTIAIISQYRQKLDE